jgi:hypothetical protein
MTPIKVTRTGNVLVGLFCMTPIKVTRTENVPSAHRQVCRTSRVISETTSLMFIQQNLAAEYKLVFRIC